MISIAVVILNWNGRNFLEKFLPSLVRHTRIPDAEIIVADNGSTDDSLDFLAAFYPEIRSIPLDENHGFSGGYNRALEQIDASYYLLLNSDIEVGEGWLEPLLELMESDQTVAACGPKIRDYKRPAYFEYAGAAGGYLDKYGYPFCRGRIFDVLEEDRGQYEDSCDVFWTSGAAMMVRASAWKEAGGLDERFFAHMEEIDLCWRLRDLGYRISYVPGSVVYHVGGGSLDRGNPRKTFLNFRNNLLLLYKNLPPAIRGRILFRRMILDGISALRFLLQGAFRDFSAVVRAHLAFYGMKKSYKGMKKTNKTDKNNVLAAGYYPRSIVKDFFLLGKKTFGALNIKT